MRRPTAECDDRLPRMRRSTAEGDDHLLNSDFNNHVSRHPKDDSVHGKSGLWLVAFESDR
jgi:hypothetical protein